MDRPIALHDSLTGERSTLAPPDPSSPLRLYCCGPTVYNDLHVGNFRTLATFDVLRRALAHFGYRIDAAMNLTDVDDKVIRKAQAEGVSPADIAQRYEARFLEDQAAMNISPPNHMPRATEFVDAMVEDIAGLVERGAAYAAPDGSVYFRARAYPGYGQLSKQPLDGVRLGARVEPEPGKEDDADFALWKAHRAGEPVWPSPWGRGRPGWHIECTTMADRVLGRPLDLHGGGSDLLFPHHENERAQAEALRPQTFARRWLHTGMLLLDGVKASKSLGNVGPLRALRERYDPMAIRLLFLQAHYAHPLNLSEEALDSQRMALMRVREVVQRVEAQLRAGRDRAGSEAGSASLDAAGARTLHAFDGALADDLNAPAAAAALFDWGRVLNQAVADPDIGAAALDRALALYRRLWGVLGVDLPVADGGLTDARSTAVDALVAARQAARASRDWAQADRIRGELDAMGVAIEDTREGARWRWLEERV